MPTKLPATAPCSDDTFAKRRFRSKQERRQIAEESLEPGASMAVAARRHGVNVNQVFHWRKLLRDGRLEARVASASAQLLPVRVAEIAHQADDFVRPYPGTMHLELGRVRVRLEGAVDPGSLRLILEHLGR
jgi:transposase